MSLTDTLDSFFLTRPLVTSDLKDRVEKVKAQLTNMQFDYSDQHNQFTMVQADLLKMEEKSDYLTSELTKTLALFEVPPDGDAAKAHEFMMQHIHNPAEWASLYSGAAGGGLWLVSKAGPKFLKLLSKSSRFSKAGKLAKSTKWLKIAKLGKATVVFSVVVFAADFVVQIMVAGAVNSELNDQWAELKKQSAIAKKEVNEITSMVTEANSVRDDILSESGCDNIDAFVKDLNGAITALGRQAGYMRTARRMLLAGLPAENVELFVQDLPPNSIRNLARKLDVERGILNGEKTTDLAASSGLNDLEVAATARLMRARSLLAEGKSEEHVVTTMSIPASVVEGLAETLDDDEQHAISQIGRGATPEKAAAQSLLPVDYVTGLQKKIA